MFANSEWIILSEGPGTYFRMVGGARMHARMVGGAEDAFLTSRERSRVHFQLVGEQGYYTLVPPTDQEYSKAPPTNRESPIAPPTN